MASFNRVILLGNLTRDPELRYITSGKAVTDLGLAVNDRHKNANGEWVEQTTFVDVTLWGRTAEVACEYLTKGRPVLDRGPAEARYVGGQRRPEAIETMRGGRADAVARQPRRRDGRRRSGPSGRRAPRAAGDAMRPVRPTTTLATCLRPSRPAAMISRFDANETWSPADETTS